MWMLDHGFTLSDLMNELENRRTEAEQDIDLRSLFADWEFDCGFGSQIWPCYDEFLDCEYPEWENTGERITRRASDGSLVFPSELVGVPLTPDNELMCRILHRLAAYEDTDFDPEAATADSKEKWYAVTRWGVDDVIWAAAMQGITLTPEQADMWWRKNERKFCDLLTESGNETLSHMDFTDL